MNEMLGNQYFLARKYDKAAEMLEKALIADKANKAIRRKLIICYAQNGQVDKALDTFVSLIKDDKDFIINTNPIDDDCPCPELVYDMERKFSDNQQSIDYLLVLGMLWLYCNKEKSVQYFEQAYEKNEQARHVKAILALLD